MNGVRVRQNGRVSVIIPAHNRAALIGRAIRSVLDQTAADCADVTVVDDGSTDDTAAVVQSLGHHVRYVRQEKAGAPTARNRGILAQCNEFVAFLDSDDEWHPDKLQRQLAALSDHSDVVLVCGDFQRRHPDGRCVLVKPPPVATDTPCDFLAPLLQRNFVGTSVTIVRAAALQRTGLFRRELLRSQDYHLWLRLAQVGPGVYLSGPLATYSVDAPGNLSRGGVRQAEFQLRARYMLSGVMHRRPELRAASRRGLADCLALLRDCAFRDERWPAAVRYALRSLAHAPLHRRRWEWFRPVDALWRRWRAGPIRTLPEPS
jgi:glycosyltransferase involved in cell wall biosynthesis